MIHTASFGDFYNKKKKKISKEEQARRAGRPVGETFGPPQPQVIQKGKKEKGQNW